MSQLSICHDAAAPAVKPALRIRFPALPERISEVRRQVRVYVEELGFAYSDTEDVILSVGEACCNAIHYGAMSGGAPATVSVSCLPAAPDGVQIDIRNSGTGFQPDLDALAVPPPADTFATQGRGFALMCALCNRVEVFSDHAETVVRLWKHKSC